MKTKQLTVLSLAAVTALMLSFVESVAGINLFVPGIKLGLANAVPLLFIAVGRYRAALIVNILRILLSAIFFGNPVSLIYSVAGGVLSWAAMCIASKVLKFSAFGISFIGGIFHNLGQLLSAAAVFGSMSVLSYLPYLIIAGAVCGALTGVAVTAILKNKNVKNFFLTKKEQ